MTEVENSQSTPTRFKHTQPPPDNVCIGCWWERKYKHLETVHKQTRIMMLKLVNGKRKARQRESGSVNDDEDISDTHSDDDVMELVEVFKRGRDD